jgi:signal transduction histidine kinase
MGWGFCSLSGVSTQVLIFAPAGRDTELACAVMEREQLTAEICSSAGELVARLSAGAGTALIADEALDGNIPLLHNWVKAQPAWSDFPFIILTGSKARAGKTRERFALMQPLGNITLLQRPLRSITLLTVVRTALRARERQYEVEHHIQEMRQAEADRTQAYAREGAARAQIELLNHVGGILSAELNLDALLPAIVDAGTDLSGADVGVFFSEGPPAGTAIEGARKFALRCVSGLPLAETSALLGEHALIDAEPPAASEAWIKTVARRLSLENSIALPVRSRPGALVGILFFGRRGGEPFSNRDENVASSLASQAGIAIDNARLFTMAEQERKRLEATRQVLLQSNDELRQFAYVASHDLQEPLRTVASFTQLLVSRYRDQGGPDVAEFVSHIVEGVERMSSLIRDLLQYSSTCASKTFPTQPNSAESALAEVLFARSASIQESGATITCDPLPDVWIDDRSLVLLLQNLIGNAIKYRGPQPLRIQISAEAAGDDWLFTVRDNGIGISPEYHERIFGIFKRLHGREVPGTGIGLAICQRIVQWHGGRIWVESESGSGAAFRFTVPRERQRIQRELAEFATLGALAS